jgi:maltose O-acetyltransferase
MEHEGTVIIGEYCYVGENARIWSCASIVIGDRVLISHNVNIHDNIAHPLSAKERHQHMRKIYGIDSEGFSAQVASAPIKIEDDVWIGFNSTILKGVTIGRGAVIGGATVVTKDVGPYAIMVGNPARQIGWARP